MARKRQKIVLALTTGYFFIELAGGLYYHSLALVTDASFMAINITGQALAYYVWKLAQRLPDERNTFGYERAKVLSGLFNGMLVGFLFFYVLIDAYRKITNPLPLEVEKILSIALLGLMVNAFGLIALYRYSKDMKGALVLILNDTLGSAGVVASSIIIRYSHLYFVDPLTGVLMGLFVIYPTYALIKDSIRILMEGNPGVVGTDEVRDFIQGHFHSVKSIKDIHIWGLSAEKIMLAARIRTEGTVHQRETVKGIKRLLRDKFGFHDMYLELYEARRIDEDAANRRDFQELS